MMIKRLFIVSGLLLVFMLRTLVAGQDTITVMVYNLLYYGQNTSFCDQSNNNIDFKDGYLRTILSRTRPDIFAVNEMGRNPGNATRLLENVLNHGGGERFAHATHTNTANSSIVNMLFYDQEKFGLYSEAVIANAVRDINLYTLYYRSPGLASGQDTIFLSCIVAHFKAGSTANDQQRRLLEAQAAMGYIDQYNIRGNLLFMGDFNMNSSFEQAYGLITYHPNEEIRFYDPVDKPGLWYNNPEMALYHTQSPRTGSHSCFVTGGLDDRYDQILASVSIMEGAMGLKYLEDSYKTVGQDGNRFNQSLISPPNHSEPEAVIYALYNMSDHLPVLLDLVVDLDFTSHIAMDYPFTSEEINLVNPSGGMLEFTLGMQAGSYDVSLFSMNGEQVLSLQIRMDEGGQSFSYDISHLPSGIYVISISRENQFALSRKLVLI
jgi:endonuclease/exonuclease/phosphatase family metal-dependent hydrolase